MFKNKNSLLAAVVISSIGMVVPSMAGEPTAEIEDCEYNLSFDTSMVRFGNVQSGTVRYATLKNDSIANSERSCGLKVFQIKLTHMGQEYGSEAFSYELVNDGLNDSVLDEGETAVFKITMQPNYDDNIVKYEKTDLWIQAQGYKNDGSKTYIKAKTHLRAIEIAQDSECSYGLAFDKNTYSFGTVNSGQTVTNYPVLTNTGTCPVAIVQEKIVGAEPEGYQLNGTGQTNIFLPGEKVEYSIDYTPSLVHQQNTYSNTDVFVHGFEMTPALERINPVESVKAVANLNGTLNTNF